MKRNPTLTKKQRARRGPGSITIEQRDRNRAEIAALYSVAHNYGGALELNAAKRSRKERA